MQKSPTSHVKELYVKDEETMCYAPVHRLRITASAALRESRRQKRGIVHVKEAYVSIQRDLCYIRSAHT